VSSGRSGSTPDSVPPLVARLSDLATLRMDAINLDFSGGKLGRSTAGEPAGLIIKLPPQHFREHPQSAQNTVLDIAAGAPTTLLFVLSDDVDELEIGDGGLLPGRSRDSRSNWPAAASTG
jgi:hypothetical protein